MNVPDPAITADTIALRHALHGTPEIGLDLPKTQSLVLEALSGLDLEIGTGTRTTSITAVLRGGAAPGPDRERPVVLLRGDMDALPVHEEVDVEFRSRHEGQMHACGHDLHTASLVGAARELAARKAELPGDVVFMFQPGEEGFDGAGVMIEEGILDAAGRRADAAWAVHVMSGSAPLGQVTSRPGPLMAASSELHVTVRGAGGHGSAPHRAKDPVPAACEMVTGLQTLLSRTVDPFQTVVLTVGEFHAGSKPNIIPESARFGATFRCFDMDLLQQVQRDALRFVRQVGAAYGLEVEASFEGQYPVTVNDAGRVDEAEAVVQRVLGANRFQRLDNPITGSEDFSRVIEAVPGAMLFLGASTHGAEWEQAPDNHSPFASFHDDALADGVALYAALAEHSLSALTTEGKAS